MCLGIAQLWASYLQREEQYVRAKIDWRIICTATLFLGEVSKIRENKGGLLSSVILLGPAYSKNNLLIMLPMFQDRVWMSLLQTWVLAKGKCPGSLTPIRKPLVSDEHETCRSKFVTGLVLNSLTDDRLLDLARTRTWIPNNNVTNKL